MNGAMPHISVARDTTSTELKILSNMDKEEYQKYGGNLIQRSLTIK